MRFELYVWLKVSFALLLRFRPGRSRLQTLLPASLLRRSGLMPLLRPRMPWCPLLTSWRLTVSGCGLTISRVKKKKKKTFLFVSHLDFLYYNCLLVVISVVCIVI
ncbi:hypothetical protein HanIR_Chr06g0258561 [Helianthus annuus]|nr:hypothetical protein HanIR_Chr06g0258561 [Helianthus annuus]